MVLRLWVYFSFSRVINFIKLYLSHHWYSHLQLNQNALASNNLHKCQLSYSLLSISYHILDQIHLHLKIHSFIKMVFASHTDFHTHLDDHKMMHQIHFKKNHMTLLNCRQSVTHPRDLIKQKGPFKRNLSLNDLTIT